MAGHLALKLGVPLSKRTLILVDKPLLHTFIKFNRPNPPEILISYLRQIANCIERVFLSSTFSALGVPMVNRGYVAKPPCKMKSYLSFKHFSHFKPSFTFSMTPL